MNNPNEFFHMFIAFGRLTSDLKNSLAFDPFGEVCMHYILFLTLNEVCICYLDLQLLMLKELRVKYESSTNTVIKYMISAKLLLGKGPIT